MRLTFRVGLYSESYFTAYPRFHFSFIFKWLRNFWRTNRTR